MLLPWLPPMLQAAQALDKAHALLLHGAAGDGLFEAATAIAQAWLCEADAPAHVRPCGHCAACVATAARRHPDLLWVLPEALARELGATAGDVDEAADGEPKAKRKPSRQIRIDDVRAAIDWVATSSGRGRGKVVLIHPAETMNPQAANALLKTLEEPPSGVRLLLACGQPAQLLPTVRSRCQLLRLPGPTPDQARSWLQAQGLARPDVLLAAASGRPLEAAAMAAAGIDAERWAALPAALRRQQVAAFSGWPLPRVVDALYKLCHDAMSVAAGADPRHFAGLSGFGPADLPALSAWSDSLLRFYRRVDHPWNEGLAIEALVLQAAQALAGAAAHKADAVQDRRPRSDTLPA